MYGNDDIEDGTGHHYDPKQSVSASNAQHHDSVSPDAMYHQHYSQHDDRKQQREPRSLSSTGITFVDAEVPSRKKRTEQPNDISIASNGNTNGDHMQLPHLAPPSPEISAGRVVIRGAHVPGHGYMASGEHKQQVDELQQFESDKAHASTQQQLTSTAPVQTSYMPPMDLNQQHQQMLQHSAPIVSQHAPEPNSHYQHHHTIQHDTPQHHPPVHSQSVEFKAWVEESPNGRWARYDRKLGSGTFKEVWLGIDTESGKEVAWNIVDMRRLSAADHARIRSETDLLTKLRHPHIIEIYDVFDMPNKQQLCFVTEKMSHTLKQHINNLHPAKIKVIKKYCRQILRALSYLHSFQPPIIHRDLKCDNIFIDGSTGDAKLGDFGLAIHQHAATSMIGTPGFMAPELFAESYNELVDIWAFGMCVFEMATNQFPYIECNGVISVLLRKGYEGQLPAHMEKIKDANMGEFVKLCLQPVSGRPSAAQLLENTIFDLTEPLPQPPLPIDTEAARQNSIAATANTIGTTANQPQPSLSNAAIASAAPATTPADNLASVAQDFQQQRKMSQSVETGYPATTSMLPVQPSPTAATLAEQSTRLPDSNLPLERHVSGTSTEPTVTPSNAISSQPQQQATQPVVEDAAAKAAAKLAEEERLRQENIRRAEQLITKVDVTKTDNPAIVSISLHCMLPKAKPPHADATDSPALTSAMSTGEFEYKQILIPSYCFSSDNYITVATQLVRSVPELKALEIDHLEDAIAARIEQSVKRYYDKWATKHRSTLNSEIMTLLSTLGINLSYAQKFIEQEVTIDDLFLLTDADLQEFLPKLGPRRRMQQYLDTEREKRKLAESALYDAPAPDVAAPTPTLIQPPTQPPVTPDPNTDAGRFSDVPAQDRDRAVRRRNSVDEDDNERLLEREKRRNKEKLKKLEKDNNSGDERSKASSKQRDKPRERLATATAQPTASINNAPAARSTSDREVDDSTRNRMKKRDSAIKLNEAAVSATTPVNHVAEPATATGSPSAAYTTISPPTTVQPEDEDEILRRRERKRQKELAAKKQREAELRRLEKLLEDAKRNAKKSDKSSNDRASASSLSGTMKSGYEESEEHSDNASLAEHSEEDAPADSDCDSVNSHSDNDHPAEHVLSANVLLRQRLARARKKQQKLPTTHEGDHETSRPASPQHATGSPPDALASSHHPQHRHNHSTEAAVPVAVHHQHTLSAPTSPSPVKQKQQHTTTRSAQAAKMPAGAMSVTVDRSSSPTISATPTPVIQAKQSPPQAHRAASSTAVPSADQYRKQAVTAARSSPRSATTDSVPITRKPAASSPNNKSAAAARAFVDHSDGGMAALLTKINTELTTSNSSKLATSQQNAKVSPKSRTTNAAANQLQVRPSSPHELSRLPTSSSSVPLPQQSFTARAQSHTSSTQASHIHRSSHQPAHQPSHPHAIPNIHGNNLSLHRSHSHHNHTPDGK